MAFSLPTTGFDFEASLSPSEKIDAAKYFAPSGAAAPTLWEKSGNLGATVEQAFSPEGLAAGEELASSLGLDTSQFLGGLAGSPPPSWTFITAPEDVSWDVANQATRVDIFGTNNPPVVAGSRGMRDLSLGNALVEGFVRNVTVEAKVASLEALMNYGLNSSDGFVSVPVYQVWANSKSYGGANAYFIIKDVKVKETMRDLQGNSTRAYVDISLMQVPAYQVNSGRDQANAVTSGAGEAIKASATTAANQAVAGTAANGGSTPGAAATQPAAGAGAPAPAPAKPAASPSVNARSGTSRFAPLPNQ